MAHRRTAPGMRIPSSRYKRYSSRVHRPIGRDKTLLVPSRMAETHRKTIIIMLLLMMVCAPQSLWDTSRVLDGGVVFVQAGELPFSTTRVSLALIQSNMNVWWSDDDDHNEDAMTTASSTGLNAGGTSSPDYESNIDAATGDDDAILDTTTTATATNSSQPLQTLQKLQQMLEDTDYKVNKNSNVPLLLPPTPLDDAADDTSFVLPAGVVASHGSEGQNYTHELAQQQGILPAISTPLPPRSSLWTSHDRKKYKQQQHQLQRPPDYDEAPSEDTDDGLGYTLPNLPVYMSDDEGEGTDDAEQQPAAATTATTTWPPQWRPLQQQTSPPPPYSGHEGAYYGPPPPPPPYYQHGLQAAHQQSPWPSYYYAPPPQHGQMLMPPSGPQASQAPPNMPPPLRPDSNSLVYHAGSRGWTALPTRGLAWAAPSTTAPKSQEDSLMALSPQYVPYQVVSPLKPIASQNAQSLAEASSRLTVTSIGKITMVLTIVALGCYAGVSPRHLPLVEYNLRFYDNVRIVSLAALAPALVMSAVLDARENDMNSVLHTFFASFTGGYLLALGLEMVTTTILRLAVLKWLEPAVFALCPRVPLPVLPWVLRDVQYRPKRITLFAADFATSCVGAPLVEEYVKLKMVQWTARLPKNFVWTTKMSPRSKKKRQVAEAVHNGTSGGGLLNIQASPPVLSANSYVSHMLAASLGIKLFDVGRRILLYTKPQDANKSFYAVCRGIFPIQELCGTMTALALAKRDLLGVTMPLWKLLAPAVVIHGMANFRGVKPIFRWNSATPWSEMQLSPFNVPDTSTLPQLLSKGFAKMMWVIILGRVLGYCIKNYYMINRQAVKRCTTYAGKHSAFSAELATAEMLKKK